MPTTDPRIVIDSVGDDLNESSSSVDPLAEYDDGGISDDAFLSLENFGNGLNSEASTPLSSGDDIDVDSERDESGEGVTPSPSPRNSRTRTLSRLVKDGDSKSGNAREPSSKPPSLDEWSNFFGKIVLKTACYWYISYVFRGIDEDALSERELDRLTLDDEERAIIVTPIAELSNKSKFMRKYGRTIVATGATFDSLVVLGKWMSRVNRIAAKHKPRQPTVKVRGSNGSSGQSTAPQNGNPFSQGAGNGRVPDGFPVYNPGS